VCQLLQLLANQKPQTGSNPVAPTIFIFQSGFANSLPTKFFTTLLTFRFAGVLAKILSAAQNETEMTGAFQRHQIINTHEKPL
jgi:hypothetical protein